MSGTLSPVARQQFMDADGDPLVGGLLYTFLAGTTTPASTWQDADLTTLNTNPIELDALGSCVIYLDATSYKFTLHDADDDWLWTQDDVQSVGATAGSNVLGELVSFDGDPNTVISATSYPSGATYDKLHAGTLIWTEDSANIPAGTYVLQAMGLMFSAGTLSIALVNLSDGVPDTPIATVTITSTAGAVGQSSAITFAAAGATKSYGIKVKVSTASGFAWAISLRRTA